jgi:hypothetical protein
MQVSEEKVSLIIFLVAFLHDLFTLVPNISGVRYYGYKKKLRYKQKTKNI